MLAGSPLAQQPPPQTPPPPQKSGSGTDVTIKVGVERVPVLFTAVDRKDRFITDLGKEDVQVFDNKKKQEVLNFTQETDLPLRVGLLIDTSNSIRDRFKFEQEAAIDFLRSIIRPGKDQVFLMSFDTNTELVQDFTDNIELMTKAVRDLRPGEEHGAVRRRLPGGARQAAGGHHGERRAPHHHPDQRRRG